MKDKKGIKSRTTSELGLTMYTKPILPFGRTAGVLTFSGTLTLRLTSIANIKLTDLK